MYRYFLLFACLAVSPAAMAQRIPPINTGAAQTWLNNQQKQEGFRAEHDARAVQLQQDLSRQSGTLDRQEQLHREVAEQSLDESRRRDELEKNGIIPAAPAPGGGKTVSPRQIIAYQRNRIDQLEGQVRRLAQNCSAPDKAPR